MNRVTAIKVIEAFKDKEEDIPLQQRTENETSSDPMLDWKSINFGFMHKVIKWVFGYQGGKNTVGRLDN